MDMITYSLQAHDRLQDLLLVQEGRPYVSIPEEVQESADYTDRLCEEVRGLNDEIRAAGIRDIHDAADFLMTFSYTVV